MSDPNATLDKLEKEEEKEFKIFLLSLIPILGLIDNVGTYTSNFSVINRRIDDYMREYRTLIGDIAFDTISRLNPTLPNSVRQNIIENIFSQTFKVKGTKNTITFDQLLFRRGEKLKNDISQEFIFRNGFNQASNKTLNEIISKTLERNQKSLAQVISNETHKAILDADIRSARLQGFDKRDKVFVYRTQNDKRVRPTHASHNGDELTIEEANGLRNTVMSEIGCRCYLEAL